MWVSNDTLLYEKTVRQLPKKETVKKDSLYLLAYFYYGTIASNTARWVSESDRGK